MEKQLTKSKLTKWLITYAGVVLIYNGQAAAVLYEQDGFYVLLQPAILSERRKYQVKLLTSFYRQHIIDFDERLCLELGTYKQVKDKAKEIRVKHYFPDGMKVPAEHLWNLNGNRFLFEKKRETPLEKMTKAARKKYIMNI